MTKPRASGRIAATVAAVAFLCTIGSIALLPRGNAGGQGSQGTDSFVELTASPAWIAMATSPDPTATPGSGFLRIGMAALPELVPPAPTPKPSLTPTPYRPPYHSTDAPFHPSDNRPAASQSIDWLTAKAYGRVALIGGRVVLLPSTASPLLMPGPVSSGKPIPAAQTLDVSWSRWIVEPPGRGSDEMGTVYIDKSYWNLCGPGASTVALYYWQQLTGHPDVTGTSGWFVDPYAAEGVPWPSAGPSVAVSGGKPIGTYWSASDSVDGPTSHGRGFLMYMATQSQPPIWTATGIAIWADSSGVAYYPTRGAPLENIEAGLNWEASGRNASGWADTWYGTVDRSDPWLARDLQIAVMLDVGRDGVPVVAGVDTYDLPNWQNGVSTPHTRHAVTIVGYDNTASPPTYTYIDTCGHACNPRGGNKNGQLHVIAQSAMVAAIQDSVGIGFSW